MKQNTKTSLQGSAVALAVSALMGCNATAANNTQIASASTNVAEMAHCYGVINVMVTTTVKLLKMLVKVKPCVKAMVLLLCRLKLVVILAVQLKMIGVEL